MKSPISFTQLRREVIVLLTGFALSALATAQEERPIDSSRWDASMERFAELDRLSPPPANAILLTGSSSIARWNNQAVAALAPLTVIPRGFGGSAMADVLHHLDTVALKYKPRAILIYEGDNDTGLFFIPEEKIVNQLEQIVAKVHHALPETRIYVLSVKPSLSRVQYWDAAQSVSARFAEIAAADPLVHYIDVATPLLKPNGQVMDDIFIEDGLHLNDKGNEIWGQTIKSALMKTEAAYE